MIGQNTSLNDCDSVMSNAVIGLKIQTSVTMISPMCHCHDLSKSIIIIMNVIGGKWQGCD